jgi:hypothetical protein
MGERPMATSGSVAGGETPVDETVIPNGELEDIVIPDEIGEVHETPAE